MTSSQHTKPFARNREIHWYPISQRSDARGSPAATSTRLALRTCSMVATRTANLSRCVLRCRGSRWANSALIPSAQTAIPLTCVTAPSHAGNHTGSVHHTQLQPVNLSSRKTDGCSGTFPSVIRSFIPRYFNLTGSPLSQTSLQIYQLLDQKSFILSI